MSGQKFYSQLYQEDLYGEAEWLRRGALEKVTSVVELLTSVDVRPRVLAELGCGTGAVIQECQRQTIADGFVAVDASADAIAHLKKNAPGITAHQGDITTLDWSKLGGVDVVILCHVLEHLEDPATFLTELTRRCTAQWLVVEVPLDDLLVSRLKSLFRNRHNNSAGHVQFFTPKSFMALLESVGLEVVSQRHYIPRQSIETVRFVAAKDGQSKLATALRLFTAHYGPRWLTPLWRRWYYAHHAVLIRLPGPDS
ncbi:MAG: class I SAM-dependent methyltransferase [Magnetococcales bacterium]|nr:class I SAM-dependent methyltransferase [Magnetococcales bacterium]